MNKLLNLLKYIGIIGASISSIAYIFVVLVLINGFKVENNTQTLVFAIVNALVGFVILCFLKVQGEIFAKNLPENKKIIEEYYSHNTKDKKYHSIKYYWITSTIKDLCTKVLSVFISTFGIIYIVVVGSNDWNLLLLALVNLLLFISFDVPSLLLCKIYNRLDIGDIPIIAYIEFNTIGRFVMSISLETSIGFLFITI